MTTQNITPAPSKDNQKPEKKFNARAYGLVLLVLGISYVSTMVLGGLVVYSAANNVQDVVIFAIMATLIFTSVAVGATLVYRPAYIPKFPVKPITVSLAITGAGAFLLFATIVIRQPDEMSQWRVIMIGLVAATLVSMIGSGLIAWFVKREIKVDADTIAMYIAVIGSVLSALLVPTLLRITDPLLSIKLSVLLLTYGFVLFFALTVLHTINKPDVKSEIVPEGHAGVVRVKDRITRVTFENSIDVKLKSEKFMKYDVRLQLTRVIVTNSLTADHVPTDVHATVEWKPLETRDDLIAFFTKSISPGESLRALARSAITTEVGLRDSLYIAGREDQIAAGVKRRISTEARQYGILIKSIAVTHALLKYPTPAESISPLTEVSRLNMMDPAVRNASTATLHHAEVLSQAEAAAVAGKESGKHADRDDDEGPARSHG